MASIAGIHSIENEPEFAPAFAGTRAHAPFDRRIASRQVMVGFDRISTRPERILDRED